MVPADLEAGESFPSLGLEFQFNIEEPFDNMASMVNQMGTVAAFEKKCSPVSIDRKCARTKPWPAPARTVGGQPGVIGATTRGNDRGLGVRTWRTDRARKVRSLPPPLPPR